MHARQQRTPYERVYGSALSGPGGGPGAGPGPGPDSSLSWRSPGPCPPPRDAECHIGFRWLSSQAGLSGGKQAGFSVDAGRVEADRFARVNRAMEVAVEPQCLLFQQSISERTSKLAVQCES